ncbi:MAG: DUF4276 family protein [Panacagrimonas sp.]
MRSVASIVEGDGEVQALPVLLRRLNEWKPGDTYVQPLMPIKVRRDRFLIREDEFRKYVLLAAAKCGAEGWLLILLDADDDCPATLGADVLGRVRAVTTHPRVSVVVANREYEAWFIAAAASLDGQRGFLRGTDHVADPERPRDAKGWVSQHIPGGRYRETTDQPAFTALFDLQQAFDGCRSFRKLCSEWARHVGVGMPAAE